jgi:hypothetical protein
MDSKVREQVRASLIEYAHTDPECDKNDVLFEIGKIYGVSLDELEESESSKNYQEEKPPTCQISAWRSCGWESTRMNNITFQLGIVMIPTMCVCGMLIPRYALREVAICDAEKVQDLNSDFYFTSG